MAASYGNSEVVAPISAPMVQMVALPVQEMVAAPGPKYSKTLLVPPAQVSMPSSFRMSPRTLAVAVAVSAVIGTPGKWRWGRGCV